MTAASSTSDAQGVLYSPVAPDVLDDPAAAHAALRARCPVHRTEVNGLELHSFAERDDIAAALRDHELWSNRQGPGIGRSRNGPGDMQHDDPPDHDRRREFARTWFVPPAVAALEPELRGLMHSLIDGVIDHGGADLYHDVALPLPVSSFCAVVGIDIVDRERFVHWADELTAAMAYPERGAAARQELRAFTSAEIRRRRQLARAGEPVPPGLLSHLATSTYGPGDEQMPLDEAVEMVNQLLVAGHETTTSLITNCVWRLLQERTMRWERVLERPELVANAVEESLRYDPPVLGLCRTNNRATTVRGVELAAQSKVMMLYASANRDPATFDAPDEFRVDRPLSESMRHLSFSWGIHHCLGAHLARSTGRVALAVLIERLPSLHLAGPTTRVPSPFLWGRKTLPVQWDLPS